MAEKSPVLRRATTWTWVALSFSALHFGGDLINNRAYVLYTAAQGLPVRATYSGVPTDPVQLTAVLVFTALLYSLFVSGVVKASEGSVRWLTLVFLLDSLWAAIGNGVAGLIVCPPPCPWRYIPTGNLQDIAHIGSLLSGTIASLYIFRVWKIITASSAPQDNLGPKINKRRQLCDRNFLGVRERTPAILGVVNLLSTASRVRTPHESIILGRGS